MWVLYCSGALFLGVVGCGGGCACAFLSFGLGLSFWARLWFFLFSFRFDVCFGGLCLVGVRIVFVLLVVFGVLGCCCWGVVVWVCCCVGLCWVAVVLVAVGCVVVVFGLKYIINLKHHYRQKFHYQNLIIIYFLFIFSL